MESSPPTRQEFLNPGALPALPTCHASGPPRNTDSVTALTWQALREPGDEATLPGRLHRPRRVMLPYVRNRLGVRHPVKHRKASQRRPGTAMPTGTSDLDAL